MHPCIRGHCIRGRTRVLIFLAGTPNGKYNLAAIRPYTIFQIPTNREPRNFPSSRSGVWILSPASRTREIRLPKKMCLRKSLWSYHQKNPIFRWKIQRENRQRLRTQKFTS